VSAAGSFAPRITLVYSPVGNGHRSAAKNIAAGLARARPEADVEVLNVLDFAPRSFRYDAAWRLIQRHGGRFWDWFFDVTNRPMPDVIMRCREAINLRLLKPLEEHLTRRQPDRIVCTHYLPAIAVAQLKRTGRLQGRTSTVITDYLSHEAWICSGVERYYVATQEVAESLVERGVAASSIEVAGIPVGHDGTATDVSAGPRLVTGRLRVLFLAAGVPRHLLRDALASLRAIGDLELDIVAGGDPGLSRQLAAWNAELGLAATIRGVLPTLRPLMRRAHVVVTKAGGLVVTECLAQGRAMVLPWPAPGHERGNRAHALTAGAAVALADARQLGATLGRFAQEPGRLVQMGVAASKAVTRGAADRIARDLLAGLQDPREEVESSGPARRIAQGAGQ
jgi:processive 1,2-diacylglycerol beta-glucosyltransferase